MKRRWVLVARFADGIEVESTRLGPYRFRFMAQAKADFANAIASPMFRATWLVRRSQ